jgi:5-methylcytosine-specific restriction protein A
VTRGYCDACRQRLGITERQAKTGSHWHDWTRGTSTQRGYGATWRRIRDQVLRNEPLCRSCHAQNVVTLATQVHHIKARADGGTDDLSKLLQRGEGHNIGGYLIQREGEELHVVLWRIVQVPEFPVEP